jgi:hypothetical protein
MSWAETSKIKIIKNAKPVRVIALATRGEIGRRIIASIIKIKRRPPSRPGMGRILKMAS